MAHAHPDPADVAIEIDVIRSFSTLDRARPAADPRESPIALVVPDDAPAASRLLDALGTVPLLRADQAPVSCAWVPRARILRALERVEPLEAIELRRLPPTDGRLWTVLHAGPTCRVATYGKRGPVTFAAENVMLGFVVGRGCGDTRCVDESDHDWEEREIRDERGVVDDSTCTRCGMPSDVYMMWEANRC